jgi:predicted transcriptional regulator
MAAVTLDVDEGPVASLVMKALQRLLDSGLVIHSGTPSHLGRAIYLLPTENETRQFAALIQIKPRRFSRR